MSAPSHLRSLVGKACFGLGTIWAAAGVLKLIFGIRATLIFFPPLDLERVSAWPSLATGLALVFTGACLERLGVSAIRDDDDAHAFDDVRSLPTRPFDNAPLVVEKEMHSFVHRTPSA